MDYNTSIECHCIVVLVNAIALILDLVSGLVYTLSAWSLYCITSLDNNIYIIHVLVALTLLFYAVHLLGLDKEAELGISAPKLRGFRCPPSIHVFPE
jgi:hypothetical protein